MEEVCRTGKVSRRLGSLKWKFLRLAMLYGIANEPLNLTTTPLQSVKVRFAPRDFWKFFTKPCLLSAKKLAPDLPRTTRNLPRTCPGPALKKSENSGICPGPLKILPWTCPGLGPWHRHPPSFFETRPAVSQLQRLLAEKYLLIKHPLNLGKDFNLYVIVMAAGLSQFQ